MPIDPENPINIQVKREEGQEEVEEGGKEGVENLAFSEALPASQALPASPDALAPTSEALQANSEALQAALEALNATSEVKTP